MDYEIKYQKDLTLMSPPPCRPRASKTRAKHHYPYEYYKVDEAVTAV